MNYGELVISIKENEGFESKPYIDPIAKKKIPKKELKIIEKHWDNLNITVGYGRCLQTNPLDTIEGVRLIENIVEDIVTDLYYAFESDFDIQFFELPDYVQNVLVEMAYQMGVKGLMKFKKTISFIRLYAFEKAAEEMLNSKWARQTPNRAKKLSNLMKGGF